MIWLVVIAALVLLGGAVVGYATWFRRRATGAFAYCRVELLEEGSGAVSSANVTLVGTPRAYRLVRLTHDATVDRSPLSTPPGFELEHEHDMEPGTVSWIPRKELRFVPNQPIRFTFPFDPQTNKATRVTGWIETKIGVGGTLTFFHVPVGPLPHPERALVNLESRVRAEAVTRGIIPADHPEWDEVVRGRSEVAAGPSSDVNRQGKGDSRQGS